MGHDDDRRGVRPPPLGIRARAVAWGGGAIALTIALVVFAVRLLIGGTGGEPFTSPGVDDRTRVDPGQLRSAPRLERRRYFEEQQQRLQQFGWVDESAGIARIPIDAAMDLIARGVVDPSMPSGSGPLPTGSVAAATAGTIAAARAHVLHREPNAPAADGTADRPSAETAR